MHPKVLLADDNLTVQRIVSATLRGGGFDVAVVDDGSAALESVKTTPPDLILADFNLEGINLFAFAKKARAEKALADIPIWALVGPTDTYDSVQLKSAGIQSCFKKPIDSLRLLQEVKNCFQTNNDREHEPTLHMGPLPPETAGLGLSASQAFPSEIVKSAPQALSALGLAASRSGPTAQTDSVTVVEEIPLSFCGVRPTVEPLELCPSPMPSPDVMANDVPPKNEAVVKAPFVFEAVAATPSPVADESVSGSPAISPNGNGLPSRDEVGPPASHETPPTPAIDSAPNTAGALSPAASVPAISTEQVEQAVAAALPEILRSILTPELVHAALEKVAREMVPPIAEAEIVKEIKRLEPSAT